MSVVARGTWAGHQPGSREYRRLVWALLCAGIACFAALYAPQGVLPLVARSMRVSEAQSALLVSAATMGLALGVLPWSWVADRIGRLTAMRIAMVASAVLGLAWTVCPGFEAMVVLRVLQGLALGGIPGLAVTYLHEEVSSSQAMVAAATYVSGTTLGGISGRMIAGPVAEVWGWRWGVAVAWLVAALGSVAFVVLAPPARGFVRDRGVRAGDVLRNVGVNLRDVGMLVLYAQAFLLMGGFVAVYNYLGFRLEAEPFGLSAAVTSLLFLAYLSGTLSSRQAGRLAGRLGRRAVLMLASGTMLAGIGLTLVDNLIAIAAGLLVVTGGFFGAHAIASGWVGARAEVGRAQAASLYTLFYYLGSSVLGWVGGVFFGGWQWPGVVALFAGLVLAASALVVVGARALRSDRADPAEGSEGFDPA
ncbi:MFS transporter [Kineosporia sp. NBRC 101677]|uniref:MFS transporter n=1 Tax=Kineosporia sp. NBRC 101677 TaxID=3032197 RepID=UPI002552E3BE|nr:MFS transporter [Kineosporia sp. NBRC 101677]